MRRGAAGRDLRPSDAPILVLSSTPRLTHRVNQPRYQCMATASGVPLEEPAGRCSMRHAALVAADAVPQSFNTVHVALRWGRGHSNSGQPVAAQALAPRLSKLPLLGSNQDSPDPESGVLPVTPRGSDYGAEGARTPDLLGAIQALSQLSYSPVRARNITSLPLFSKQARVGLIVLTFINLFNYLDRWIVAALAESVKHSELHLSDTQLGSLMTGFLIVYMLAAPLFGRLGDTRSRSRLLAIGVAIWSAATALAGLSRSYFGLFAARAAVGIGEAAYGTISPALLADYFPRQQRGRVFAVFFAAIPIGSALGYIVGGLVDRYFGWRQAFFVAGIPGLVLAFLALRLYDPPRGCQDSAAEAPASARSAYRTLIRNPAYLLTVLGYAAYTFAIGALA